MAFLSPILSIGSTLFAGVAALGQANYQSQVAKNNAEIAKRNAGIASEQAQIRQARSDREYAAARGNYLSTVGASGIDPLGGSQQAVLGLIDRNRQEAGIDIRRQGEMQSTDFNNKAAFYKGEANSAKSAGISSLVGSVLKAGGQAYDAFSPGGSGTSSFGSTKKRAYPWSN